MTEYHLSRNRSIDPLEKKASDVLQIMLKDMELADEIYKPSNFWKIGLSSIIDDIQRNGFRSFRDHQSSHIFYVPEYSKYNKARRFSRLKLKLLMAFSRVTGIKNLDTIHYKHFTGLSDAIKEYQIFCAANLDKHPFLGSVSESLIGGGERFIFDGRYYSKSFLNYLLGLSFLKKMTDTTHLCSVLEIGGGYGTFGEILLKANNESFYVDVDIPPVAAVATYYLNEIFGSENVLSYDRSREISEISLESLKTKYKCVVLCPWQLPKVTGTVDLFANFISFQEMEPDIVQNYISLVQPITKHFVLLRNSKYGKKIAEKPGEMGVKKPVTTDSIIQMFNQFKVIGRNSVIFGNTNEKTNFHSEVICLQRG